MTQPAGPQTIAIRGAGGRGVGFGGLIKEFGQLEQVAYWHQAHSFVRGNWGNEGRATFMLLAKSCHDID